MTVPKIGLWGVITRGALTVLGAMLTALQIDPTFRNTGVITRQTGGAVLVVGGLALLGFINQSIAHLQKQDEEVKDEVQPLPSSINNGGHD
jgi:hypothetical protein